MEQDIDKLEDFSPERVAQDLFIYDPKLPLSYQIVAESKVTEDLTYLFEILIIIFLEGILILTDDLTNIDLNCLTKEHLTSLNPWFYSLGFKINVNSYFFDDEEYKKYYCKILIKDGLQKNFFLMKNINKKYHFIINGTNLQENKEKKYLKDIYGIFENDNNNNNKGMIFKISFDFYIPDNPKNKIL